MPLIVGNLLTDTAANSFISLADAEAYFAEEAALVSDTSELGRWLLLDDDQKEASLIVASRWMAASLPWGRAGIAEAQLPQVGYVAARLAVHAAQGGLWASEAIGKTARRMKAGSVEIEYADASTVRGAKTAGKLFPWVYPMLRGLLGGAGQHDVVRR